MAVPAQVVVMLLEPIQRRSEPTLGESEAPSGNAAIATAAAHVVEYDIRKCSELFKVQMLSPCAVHLSP